MAIYLDETQNEDKILLKLLENSSIYPEWIKKSLINKVQSDMDRKAIITSCEHDFGTYKGKKQCCTKCSGYDVGMGESWELEKLL